MPYYLVQAAYTPEAWAGQLKDPQNRLDVLRPLVERLGGKLETAFFAFGEYDIVAIGEYPDNVSAAAFSLVAAAGGAVKSIKTTPLMTIEEGLTAMRRGAEVAPLYQSPARTGATV
jgi:uncharacterized protein with GYD domain